MFKKLFLQDKFILCLILINAVVIFINGYNLSSDIRFYVLLTDNLITFLFIVEMLVKMRAWGIRQYFASSWNILDFTLIIISIPALLAFVGNLPISNVSYLLVFRILRVFKSFRFLKFIPGISDLLRGVQRALKASVLVLVGFSVYIFIIGVLSFYIFRNTAPEYFNSPLHALYTIFKIFTVEGWFEIPEQITKNYSPLVSFFTYAYFIFILMSGGIFGLSLVNSIFVDAMVSDNNDELETKIDNLDSKISDLILKLNANETRKDP